MQAMMSENVEKSAAARTTMTNHVQERERAPVEIHPEQEGETVHDGSLRECADAGGEAFPQHECRARGRAGEEFLNDAEVALPDDVDAVKYGHEEDALRQDPRGDEVQIGDVSRVHRPAA